MRIYLISFLQNIVINIQIIFFKIYARQKKSVSILNLENLNKCKFIFVYASYSKSFSNEKAALLNQVKEKGGFTIYLTNYEKFDKNSINKKLIDILIIKDNKGYDFSQYFTASKFIMQYEKKIPEKIIFCNDSCFYLEDRKYDFIKHFLDNEYDLIGTFEISGNKFISPWHISSWLFSISKSFLFSKEYSLLLKNYIPINNKHYSIRYGEHALTKAALTFSGRVKAVFNNQFLLDMLLKNSEKNSGKLIDSDFLLFPLKARSIFLKLSKSIDFINFMQYFIYQNSPASIFSFYLIEKLSFPFIKKDLFFFEGQAFDNLPLLDHVCKKLPYSAEVKNYYKLRMRFKDLNFLKKVKINLGLF
jgi:hypothetical protein